MSDTGIYYRVGALEVALRHAQSAQVAQHLTVGASLGDRLPEADVWLQYPAGPHMASVYELGERVWDVWYGQDGRA